MNLFWTILLAFIVMLVIAGGFSIGYFLTGKSRLKIGKCGNVPKKDQESGRTSCSLCGSEKSCEKEEKPDETSRRDHPS